MPEPTLGHPDTQRQTLGHAAAHVWGRPQRENVLVSERVKKPIPFGKYYLLDRISVGGMAEVFRAKAFGVEGFERLVAVKRILPSIAEDTDFITMFIDEAKIAVQLNHANIAQIFDLGKVGDAYFIALEYVHGKDVRTVFDLARKEGEALPVGMSCYVMMKVLEGLDYAHNKRDATGRDLELVHRDISPQNLLISYDGDVKLIDFGIAKAAGKAGKTQTGILKGKFGYLSPEQVAGVEIDRRSDVFGAGIVLYELLTLERLFAGDSDFSTIEKVRNIQIPAPSSYNKKIPKELERIVLKALSRDVDTRFQSANELHDALQSFLYSSGEAFARRDLSAWMRKHFPDDVTGAHIALSQSVESTDDLREATDTAPTFVPTDNVPILEPAESKAVIPETREMPETAKPKNKSTIVGMPAVLPPADLAAPRATGRSVPPPPPPPRGGEPTTGPVLSGKSAPPGAGRSVPPPPPRAYGGGPASSAPNRTDNTFGSLAAQGRIEAAPRERVITPVGVAIPSVSARRSSSAPPASRSMPPPPPRASVPPGAISAASVAGGSYAAVATGMSSLEPTTAPGANPVLDMDWDDEELSTQIYDRPEDQLAGESGSYENVDGGFDDVAAAASPYAAQSMVSTYVPPSNGMGIPGVQISPKAYSNSDSPPSLSHPPRSSRAAQVTQPIITHQAAADRGRGSVYAGVGVATFIAVCFALYFAFKTETPGVVQLTTHPTDSTVLFDGQTIGSSSPFVVTSVIPGEKHLLEVRKDGYRAWSQEVQVQAGQTLQFPVTLQPGAAGEGAVGGNVVQPTPNPGAEVATGGFSLESTPPGAKVFLDGLALGGMTPLRVANLVPRSYEVRLKLADFREYITRLDVKSGVDMSLPRVSLVPERVQVRIVSDPAGADAVAVRGDERRALGRTPLSVSLDNNDQAWTIEVAREKFERFSQELKPEGTSEIKIAATLIRSGTSTRREPTDTAERAPKKPREEASSGGGNGTLRINSRPWSQVFVDGKLIGNTPQMNMSLSEGQHRISLHNPEFNLRKNLSVTIRAGQVETQIIALQ